MKEEKGSLLAICLAVLFAIALGAVVRVLWSGAKMLDSGAKCVVRSVRNETSSSHKILQLPFVENRGQVSDAAVRYLLQKGSVMVYFTNDALIFHMSASGKGTKERQEPKAAKAAFFKMTFAGANKTKVEAAEKLPGKVNYFKGRDKSKWHTDIATYEQVLYKGVYLGVDMVVLTSYKKLKYEFHVAPGTDTDIIQIDYSGIEGLSLDDKGNLHIKNEVGEVIDFAPVAYQQVDGQRIKVEVSYRLIDNDSYGFSVTGQYDKKLPLIIDPAFVWSTYLGDSGYDEGRSIAVDSSGFVYVAGKTTSSGFPDCDNCGDPNEYDGNDHSHNGGYDGFVAKFTSDGHDLVYWTFIGGGDNDCVHGLAVDSNGEAYITGYTSSDSSELFPIEPNPGAYDTSYNQGKDAFMTIFSADGNTIRYSTYIGGSEDDIGWDIAVDANGDVYLGGYTTSDDFPVKPNPGAYDTTYDANGDYFVAKLYPDEEGEDDLRYSTFLGGYGFEGLDLEAGAKIDVYNGDIYITGTTSSNDLTTTEEAYQSHYNGNEDLLIAVLSPDKLGPNDMHYLTYLGGTGAEGLFGAFDIAVDCLGDIYVTSGTGSGNFPIKNAYQENKMGFCAVFVSKIDHDIGGDDPNDQLIYSTYIGGTDYDVSYGITVVDTVAFVTGSTDSMDDCDNPDCPDCHGKDEDPDLIPFPNTDLDGPYHPAGKDFWHYRTNVPFICALTSDGSNLLYSTFFGCGNYPEGDHTKGWGHDIAVDSEGRAYVIGYAEQDYIPIIDSDTFDTTWNEAGDAFVCRFDIDLNCLSIDSDEYADWSAWGKPDCWCYQRQCRGDTDGTKTGPFWVGVPDLNLLTAAYNKTDAELAEIDNGICADLDHNKVGSYRVNSTDLSILQTYYNKTESNVPKCDEAPIITGPYNFWTNVCP